MEYNIEMIFVRAFFVAWAGFLLWRLAVYALTGQV